MRVSTTTLWLPKKGNTDEEYEDAAAPLERFDGDVSVFRCAVADGATETSFSGVWAKLLVDGFVAQTDRNELKAKWQESWSSRQLAWYAEQKAESGAFAALIGLIFTESGGKTQWEAEAIGDSCMIMARGGKVIERFPLSHSEEFNSSPVLLCSNSEAADAPGETFVKRSGDCETGDVFYLLTDAIAKWSYKREEDHGDAALFLQGLTTQEELAAFVDLQRSLFDEESRPLMRNDDVTLIRVVIG